MNILGLNYIANDVDSLFNDAAAALIINGEVVGNYEEERFNRIKHSPNVFPIYAVKKLLQKNNLTLNDIDVIGVRQDSQKKAFLNLQQIESRLKDKFIYEYSSHHESHIYNAYYQSRFDEATALVIDGDGNLDDSVTIASIKDGNIKIFKKYSVFKSLGNMYEFATQYCGFGDFGEGKLMGLASYGVPLKTAIYEWNDDMHEIDYSLALKHIVQMLKYNDYTHESFKKILTKYFETVFYPYKKLTNNLEYIYYKDFAATIQKNFNDIVLNLVKYAKELTNSENLILCGGCIQNCNTNESIIKSKIFKNVYAAPNSHDAGEALGNALYAAKLHNEKISFKNYNDKYYNLTYNINDIDSKLLSQIEIIPISQKDIVSDLAKNKIIGWFQDGSEIGHRALCHRSIIANPSYRENLNIINLNIKHRELFRPLAPVVPDVLFDEIFDSVSHDMAEYMFRTIKIRKNKQRILQAVCHIDGTTRPQLLTKSVNEYMYNLLLAFYAYTNVPCLINTSFNQFNEPIVETINDAINMLLSIDKIDYIVFNTKYKIFRKS